MVIERIRNHLQWAILARKIQVKQWKGVTPTINFNFPRPRANRAPCTRIVRWQPPPQNWTKLNFAGAYLGNTLPAGGGGVIRDNQGWILRGFVDYYNAESGVEAGLKALLKGVDMARRFGDNIWIETDALDVAGLIGKRNRGAVEHRHTLTEIRNKLRGCQTKIFHIPKEGNRIAISLANQGGRETQQITFDQDTAPPLARALARMDRLGFPNVRRSVEVNDEED